MAVVVAYSFFGVEAVLSENSNEINRHDSGLACNAEMAFSEVVLVVDAR